MTVVLISDGDREHLGCQLLAQQLRRRGQACLTVGPGIRPTSKSNPALAASRADLDLTPLQLLSTPLLEQARAIGLFIRGADPLQRFIDTYRTLCRSRGRQPAPVFSGPVAPQVGDQLVNDLSKRLSCDLLLVPGERQRAEAAAMTFNWPETIAQPAICSAGFWFLPERPPLGTLTSPMQPTNRTLVALVQGNTPSQFGGKAQILRQLISWAERAPEWTVVVTRDHTWSTGSTWVKGFQASDWSFPPNLLFSAPGQMLDLIAGSTSCITVSSSWIFTAMAWGRPSMIIGDFGVHTEASTTAFFGCGCMHRLSEVEHPDQLLDLPGTNRTWLDAMGWGIHDGADRLLQALDQIDANRA